MIPVNKSYLIGEETECIKQAVVTREISGNSMFSQKNQYFFEEKLSIFFY